MQTWNKDETFSAHVSSVCSCMASNEVYSERLCIQLYADASVRVKTAVYFGLLTQLHSLNHLLRW